LCWVAEDGRDAAGVAIGVDEGYPLNGEAGIGLLQVDGFGFPIPGQTGGKLVGDVEQPGITGVASKEDELADGDNTPVVSAALSWM